MRDIPKFLSGVDGIFQRPELDLMDDYWFSYKNTSGDELDMFFDHFLFNASQHIISIKFSEVSKIELVVPNAQISIGCGVTVEIGECSLFLPIDTKSKEKYLDVFAIHKAMHRRIVICKG